MILFSAPEIPPANAFRIDLPETGRDYWIPVHSIIEVDTIATSSSPSKKFRQVIRRDVSSVSRTYEVLLENERAEILAAMMASDQTSWYCVTEQGTYEVNMLAEIPPADPDKVRARIEIRVIRKVS